MIRRLAIMLSAAALALPMLSGSSGASVPKVDASQYTIHCDTVVGTVGFAPPLSATGAAGSELIKLKAVLGGCTATPTLGGDPVQIASANVTGKLIGTSQNCSSLLGSAAVTGSIVATWKVVPGTATLVVNKSTLTPANITGGLFAPGAPFTGTYGSFHVGGAGVTVTGSFAGTDGGATSVSDATTGQDAGNILSTCGSAKGLKSINLGIGDITLK